MFIVIVTFFILLVILFFVGYFLLVHLKQRGLITRSLNMSLFLVTLPRYEYKEDTEKKEEKERIALMEQFLGSFVNLRIGKIKSLRGGTPYIVFEMAVHNKGENIHTYISVPKNLESILEKQVHGFFPDAEVEKVKDYNIFNPKGASVASQFTLSKISMLPLLTYQTLSADPLGNILTALSKIEQKNEGAAFQLILRPQQNKEQKKLAQEIISEMQRGVDFSNAFKKVVGSAKKDVKEYLMPSSGMFKSEEDKKPEDPQRGVIDETTIKALQSKLNKHHFLTNIRLVASAQDELRAQHILSEMEAAFVQFDSAVGNSLKVKKVKKGSGAFKRFIFQFSFRIPDDKPASLLSTEEIASLFHFPTTRLSSIGVRTLKHKFARPPEDMPKDGIVLGENIYRGEKTLVRLQADDRRRHLYIVGQTGTGKSVLMYNMAKQDIEAGEGVAIIDPHGGLVEDLLRAVPENRKQDIVWFDPGDRSRPFGLNMLEYNPKRPEQKSLVVNELLSIFKKLFLAEHMGPIFDQYFRGAALLLLEDYENEIPVLSDINKVLTDVSYRRKKLDRIKNIEVVKFWTEQAEKAGGEASLSNMAPYITSKIDGFVSDEFIKPIISEKYSSLNFRDAMDNKKIILVNLSKGKIGDLNANLIGLVIVGKLLISALSRVDILESARDDFFLYIDEFQNFTTDSIATILAEARKYKLNLTIAHQFIKQLEEKIRDSVFGNVGSMVAFRVGADDAEFLEKHFEPTFAQSDLINIPNFNAHAKLLINNQTIDPFNFKTLPPE
ncbi:MAG: hypothetical protein A3H51_01220 [Candidatus Spechtbacteria bacterium RIFCSPLOWO2_02_FULL_38_8]|uniref:Helicase HerA central domain-containing protein n=1 Tax=Candidatus Spechtbacteria bacterium RIFCSPLOWO2_02_FULL_38_8 TaxID=1802164 RepID=A0A1G2HHL7_9BACT|nr:MAG: hypothetical protein A3H51_01220 [Candidatus Spechtbacteria bacterium RIFCSPLOWO2_02_FULL_38_8]